MEYNIFSITDKLESILAEVSSVQDLLEKTPAGQKRQELEIREKYLWLEVERTKWERKKINEGLTEEVINGFASVDAREEMLTAPEKENEYNLSSEYIISSKTGEKMNIKYLTPSERIKLIYEHTGEIVKIDDKVFNDSMMKGFNRFIASVSSKKEIKKHIAKYGPNWQEEMFKLYKEGYTSATEFQIERIVASVDKQNEIQERQNKPSEKENYEQENVQLRNKVAELEQLVGEMREENKKTMEEVKNRFLQLSSEKQKDNFEFTSEEKTAMLNAVGIQLNVVEDKEKNTSSFVLIQKENEPMEVTARNMMICKWFDIETKAVVNGLEVSNKDFNNAQEIVQKGASNPTPVVATTQNKTM